MNEPKQTKVIPKNQLNTWLTKLTEYSIWAPVQRDNYSEFGQIKDLKDLDLSIRNTVLSPKDLIFAQTKTMFEFKLGKKDLKLQAKVNNEYNDQPTNRLLLGIRPCDAHAFITIDRTFDSEFKDPYYLTARERATLVGLACQEPDINCFCTSVGFDPFDGSGLDIMMVDLGESYLFNIYTEKGEKLINPYSEFFSSPTPEQLKQCDEQCDQVKNVPTRKVDASGKPEKLEKLFESDYWENISRKCLGCGICTYLCPTCYCFDITDEKLGSSGRRMRTWDSCMYPEYTVHASGYNPRPARLNRLRNRVYHKFKYYPDLYNMFGCVGCGRCVRYCPTNVDIIDIVNGINEIEIEGEP